MTAAELALLAIQTLLVLGTLAVALWTVVVARKTLASAERAAAEQERDRLARLLGDVAVAVAGVQDAMYRSSAERRAAQTRLRALLVGVAGYSELSAAFDLADAPIAPDRAAAENLATQALAQVREAAEQKFRIVRAPTAVMRVTEEEMQKIRASQLGPDAGR